IQEWVFFYLFGQFILQLPLFFSVFFYLSFPFYYDFNQKNCLKKCQNLQILAQPTFIEKHFFILAYLFTLVNPFFSIFQLASIF
ncbi:MAG TPA: hypothetical protein DIV40_06185, partial [Clostridiales bacterium]|nr:hypothetical protein [Clostridiales bacterium]